MARRKKKTRKRKTKDSEYYLGRVESMTQVIIPNSISRLKLEADGKSSYDLERLEELIFYCKQLWQDARNIRDL